MKPFGRKIIKSVVNTQTHESYTVYKLLEDQEVFIYCLLNGIIYSNIITHEKMPVDAQPTFFEEDLLDRILKNKEYRDTDLPMLERVRNRYISVVKEVDRIEKLKADDYKKLKDDILRVSNILHMRGLQGGGNYIITSQQLPRGLKNTGPLVIQKNRYSQHTK